METKKEILSEALRSISAALFDIAKAIETEEDMPTQQGVADYYIGSEEAAERMRCCRQSVYNRVRNNLIKGKFVGSRLMVSALSVDTFNKHFNKKLKS